MATTIPSTMKALQVVKYKETVKVQEVAVPTVTAGTILVKVAASGMCHTDVHAVDADHGEGCPAPLTLGHEGCGVVVKVGDGVTNVKVGDRVGVPFLYSACGTCVDCLDGWETVCHAQKNAGFSVNGGLAEYVLADPNYVGSIPEGLSFEQAAPILCAGVTVYKALKMSNVKPGQWVVISGAAGGLGHLACQYAKAMGMKVMAITRKATSEKDEMFRKYGVDYVIDQSKEKTAEMVLKVTNGIGADGVVCLTPENSSVGDAVYYVKRRGVIVPVGIPSGNISIHTLLLVIRGISVVGSIVGTRNDLREALQFAAEGKVQCKLQTMKLDNAPSVLDNLRQGNIAGRVVFVL